MLFDVQNPGCLLSLRWERPGVLVLKAAGKVSADIVDDFNKVFDAELAKGDCHLFVDFFELEGYAPQFRSGGVDVVSKHRKHTKIIYIGVRSKLVAMGVSVANIVLGNLEPLNDPKLFAEKLAKAR